MGNEAPPFWWEKSGWQAALLAPLAAIYGAVAKRRLVKSTPPNIAMPVLCIGNFTVGGSGKTPTCIAFANTTKALGLHPGIVSRGYGGSFSGVHLVDVARDTAKYTGDEPLLLAQHAPVAISSDRLAAAKLLATQGCDFIIMDDGFQSARLYADYALLVVDAIRGIGNGKVIPAGPLRAPLLAQMQKASGLLRISPKKTSDGKRHDAADAVIRLAARANKPVFDALLHPVSHERVAEQRYLAFAGIGNPQKFYDSVTELGGVVVQQRSFGDHHAYDAQDLRELLQEAKQKQLTLATTAKDYVRLTGLGDLSRDLGDECADRDWLAKIAVFDVELDFGRVGETGKVLERIIKTTRQNYLERSLSL